MKIIPLPGRLSARPTFWQRMRREKRVYWGLGLTTLLTILLASRVIPDRVNLHVDDVAPRDIVARRTQPYFSNIATERARITAAAAVLRQYDNDPRAAADAEGILRTIFAVLSSEKAHPRQPEIITRVADAKKALPANVRLSDQAIQTALSSSDETLSDLEGHAAQALAQVMDTDIRSDNDSVDTARSRAAAVAAGMHLPPGATRLVTEAAQSAVRPNRLFSVQATEKAREQARQAVDPVEMTVTKDEVIVRKGEKVTPEDVEQFTALGLQHPKLDLPRLLGLFLFLGGVVLASSFFLRYYEPGVYNDLKKIALLCILVSAGALGLKVGYSFLGVPLTPSQLGYLTTLWIAMPAMLAAVLINVDTALLISTMLAVTAGVAWEIEPRYLAVSLVSSLVGIYGVSRIRDRSDLMRVAGWMAASNVALVLFLGLLNGDSQSDLLQGIAWVFGTGIGSPLLFWLLVAALERPFGLVTHIGLLELSDLNRELLRRLQWEAPGTYHHSLGVAVLAEAAAEAIGADGLLARVAAYYHDIGKMRRPQYFVENQLEDNVHDHLAPTLSTIAITAHVKEGLELARQYHMPPVIRDAIVQHHGTSLVSFFYHQATGGESDDTLEQQFRYEGPKPQSKEMAILMLADGVEAIGRSIDKPTPQKLEQAVDAFIAAKLKDGQFDECDLTFRDIGHIRAAFVRTTVSMLHNRIEYPNVIVADPARAAAEPAKSGPETAASGASRPNGGADGSESAGKGGNVGNGDKGGNGGNGGNGGSGNGGSGSPKGGSGNGDFGSKDTPGASAAPKAAGAGRGAATL